MAKVQRIALCGNLVLWAYFWASFSLLSYQFEKNPRGHPAGNGFTFWGHSIGIDESPMRYEFFRATAYVNCPSFLIGLELVPRMFERRVNVDVWFGGVSVFGWCLLGTMLLSFLQWYLIGGLADRIWQRRLRRPRTLQRPRWGKTL